MGKIDPAVLAAFKESGGKPVGVLITCNTDCSVVAESLRNEGITLKQEMPGVDIISAEIAEDEVEKLQTVQGIEAVEIDAIASID